MKEFIEPEVEVVELRFEAVMDGNATDDIDSLW